MATPTPTSSQYEDDLSLPMPPRIAGPIPFDTVGGVGPAGEGVVMTDGPEDTARTHNTVESALGVNDPPVAAPPLRTVTMPTGGGGDYGAGTPSMPMPSDPDLMAFAVPDGGPPPSNPIEAQMMDGMMNGMPPKPNVPTDEELGMQGAMGMPPLPMPPRRGGM